MPTPVRPEFLPDPALDREAMEALQRDIAAAAEFSDDFGFDADTIGLDPNPPRDAPLVAGVDQAFLADPDRAVSAVVVSRGSEVVERTYAVTDLSIPYIPGLLAFREGGPIVDALATLDCEPDLYLLDGSGRIHYRQAGIATHVGVLFDAPTVGVAKNLLCGTPTESVDGRPAGWRTPITVADGDRVDAPGGTTIGYAYQSRQYDTNPIINPLYVSPGHRVDVETAVEFVAALGGDYKLPEPTRLADAYADEAKAVVADDHEE